MANMSLYMGDSGRGAAAPLIGFLSALVIFLVVMWYVKTVLRRFRKLPAAQALRFGAPAEKAKAAKGFRLSENRFLSRNIFLGVKDVLSRKKLYVTMLAVLIISSFILIVPQNIYNTISHAHAECLPNPVACIRRFFYQSRTVGSDNNAHITGCGAKRLSNAAADPAFALWAVSNHW